MKKLILFISVIILFLGVFTPVRALENNPNEINEKIEINFFYVIGCPICDAMKIFLSDLEKDIPQTNIKRHNIHQHPELAMKFYEKHNVPPREQGVVPITFVQEQYFVGWDERIGQNVRNYVLELIEGIPVYEPKNLLERKIILPIFGEIDPDISFLALSVIFGVADGFNVCSLAALTLILSLVFTLKSRKKALVLGGIFILTTAIVYGALIVVWHKLFLVLAPYIGIMETLIGALSLIGGIYFLRQFIKSRKQAMVCNFGGSLFEKISQKMQKIFQKKTGILSLAGIVFAFAAIVAIIEFPCSAIIPVLFAGILADAGVSFTAFLFPYLSIFLVFYMLDEIIVFLISIWTMKIWTDSPKIFRFLNLFIGLLLFYVAFYFLSRIFLS